MANYRQPQFRRQPKGWIAIIAGILGTLVLAGAAWSQGPKPGARPLAAGYRLQIGAADRCPVCAMRPIKYPRFASAIQMKDGSAFYFCMLKAWLRPDVFLNARPAALGTPVAQDYFSGQPADARTVFWIAGSDVIGPMGPALVPVGQSDHVEAFRRRHGSDRVFRLEELNFENWESLTGKPFR